MSKLLPNFDMFLQQHAPLIYIRGFYPSQNKKQLRQKPREKINQMRLSKYRER